MRPQRLLHLDLKTVYSYGDQLLFELVRHAFNSWGGGQYLDLTTTRPFRTPATSAFVDDINENFDAVVIGGGGIFPRRINAAPDSGWQWDISVELLKKLKKPVIVFGAGNPPRFDPERHNPVFRKHINQTMSQSIFFGLRSTGAVEAMREYLHKPDDAPQLTLQPCPTTIGRILLPRVAESAETSGRRIGIQVGLESAHVASGLEPTSIFPQVAKVIEELTSDGWEVEFVGHKRADMAFYKEYGDALGIPQRPLYGSTDVLFEGVRTYANLPIVLGARGHSQMIPFGLNNIPLSLSTNDKIRYFAHEIGHPEWLIDPWQEDFTGAALDRIREVDARREELHGELARTQERFVHTTRSNLSTIYERLTGEVVEADFEPYTDREIRLAQADYAHDYRGRELADELARTKDGRKRQEGGGVIAADSESGPATPSGGKQTGNAPRKPGQRTGRNPGTPEPQRTILGRARHAAAWRVRRALGR